ncbi:MAG: UDP-N-acetylglucosamine 1-carboxyvinyltransferase [Oscillospiraceae bacterium]|nr:UDP-N-acetylglucosamine 1-carboxyvinyltransferase [Oscillospiraceae bacterium]
MSQLRITGGRRLSGEVNIHGAKNSALPILAAAVLVPGVSVIHNCPRLSDVSASLAILRHLGCKTWQQGDTVTVDAAQLTGWDVPDALMREMRSSVIFLGAILARQGRARLSLPGGCELGPRPIDLHLSAMERLGARIDQGAQGLTCTAGGLEGREIHLSLPSVGATENCMLAACAARGVTVVRNAAREPEIVDLQRFLNAAGARVSGAGTSVLTVQGGMRLHSVEHTVIGDRIAAATYLLAAACTGGDVLVRGADPQCLSSGLSVLEDAGCQVTRGEEQARLVCRRSLHGVRQITTAPYPGFPTDAQAPVMAALAMGTGSTLFVENMFESRYRHVDELVRMGADIQVEGRVALVRGVPRLHGSAVQAADLRGGAALTLAALGAEGESAVTGLHHIDRGYQDLELGLASLGADIRRIETDTQEKEGPAWRTDATEDGAGGGALDSSTSCSQQL